MQLQPPHTERPTKAGGCRAQRAPHDAIKDMAQEVCVEVRLVLFYLFSLDDEGLWLLVLVGTDVTRKEIVREQSHAGTGQLLLHELCAITVNAGSLLSAFDTSQYWWFVNCVARLALQNACSAPDALQGGSANDEMQKIATML